MTALDTIKDELNALKVSYSSILSGLESAEDHNVLERLHRLNIAYLVSMAQLKLSAFQAQAASHVKKSDASP